MRIEDLTAEEAFNWVWRTADGVQVRIGDTVWDWGWITDYDLEIWSAVMDWRCTNGVSDDGYVVPTQVHECFGTREAAVADATRHVAELYDEHAGKAAKYLATLAKLDTLTTES